MSDHASDLAQTDLAPADLGNSDKIRISEIFGPTVQGEGSLIGMPTVFVRTGGCDYRCSWCDTLYAVDPAFRAQWLPMDARDVLAEVKRLSGGKPILVTLSGGNPAIQPLGGLIALGQREGFTFGIETQGSIAKPWFADLDYLTISPKPPSAQTPFDADALAACIASAQSPDGLRGPIITLKFPVRDHDDLMFADHVRRLHPHLPVCLQPVNTTPPAVKKTADQADMDGDDSQGVDIAALTERYRWLVDEVAKRGWFDMRVLPQWHVHVWGNLRGV